jgi:hypothetical protein
MSKKSKKRRKAASGEAAPPDTSRPGRRSYYVAALSALALLTVSAAATRYDPVRRAVGLRPLMTAPAQGSADLPLSKEYIYAGGRLVATEEPTPAATPTPTPAGPPPTSLVATATNFNSPTATVSLTWGAPYSGSVISYVVERAGLVGQFTQVGQPVAAPATSFNDTTASEGAAYLYRVKAVYAGGASLYSNTDMATAVAFTDSQLQGVTIKAVHLTELRSAVAAVRALAGLSPATWTYPDPVSSPASQRRAVYLEDVTDLRARLDDALGPLGLPTGGYPTNPPLARGAVVNAQHFEQIRARVK